MDEKWIEKLIGYTVMAIIASYILNVIGPYLFYGVIGLVMIRVFQEHHKNKR